MAWEHDSRRRAELPPNWESLRRQVLKRDGGKCARCGEPANQVDHRRRGNDHRLSNLQALCLPCHKKKTQIEAAMARKEIRERLRKPEQKHPGLIVKEDADASDAEAQRGAAASP